MTLIKTSFLNAVAVFVKMLTLLLLSKVLAVYVGPSGYATLGQFQNAIQIITTLINGSISTGVVKYTSEYRNDEKKQQAVWRTAGTISIVFAVLLGVIVTTFDDYLSVLFLNNSEFKSIFTWLSLTLIFFFLNTLLLAILNGKKKIRKYVTANILGSIFSLIITTIIAINFGIYGALVSITVYQSFNFFITLFIINKSKWFNIKYIFGRIDKDIAKKLSKYAVMAGVSSVCIPISHIFIRAHLGETLSWEAAGYWEAMWRLSAAYLMLVTSTLSVYYLPKLSELEKIDDIWCEVRQCYKIIFPITVICSISIYIYRDLIVNLLFSSEFSEMKTLFFWQLTGDTLKIGSWIVSYIMLGRAMVKTFVISEVMFSFSFVLLTKLFTNHFGLEGAAAAHALNYLIYWIVMAIVIRNHLKWSFLLR
ncbi:MAG: O-antigen flippase [Oceanospirillaceae bacterium]|nr:O-antigen flippase [Oceanospirillaceae bacterium]